MKWLLDVNVTKGAEELLRAKGHDVSTLVELGQRRLRNGEVFGEAKERGAVLLTYDGDFLKIVRGRHPGVVVVRVHPNADQFVLPCIHRLLEEFESTALYENHVIVVHQEKITRRDTSWSPGK